MKEELIDFETAKLAKEKGFNIPVYNWYHHANPSTYYLGESYHHPVDTNSNEVHNYSAPTQSLLQKWLRDSYNIEVLVIRPYNFSGQIYWSYEVYTKGSILADFEPEDEDTTYEQALEKGLLKALNLI